MAGLGWKTWTRERLTADEMQGYLQDQVVMQFASAAARDTALGVDPDDGTIVTLLDTGQTVIRLGSAWRSLHGIKPCAVLLRSAAQSINNAAWTAINWDSEESDTDGMHAGGASIVTLPIEGWYVVQGAGNFVANATGARGVRLRRNSTIIPGGGASAIGSTAINTSVITPARRVLCAAGDTIDLQVWQSSGAALNVVGTAADSALAAMLTVTHDGF